MKDEVGGWVELGAGEGEAVLVSSVWGVEEEGGYMFGGCAGGGGGEGVREDDLLGGFWGAGCW